MLYVSPMGSSAMFGSASAILATEMQRFLYEQQVQTYQANLVHNATPNYSFNSLQNAYAPQRTLRTIRNRRGETLDEWAAAFVRLGGGRSQDEQSAFKVDVMEWETYAYELEIMAEADGPKGDRSRLLAYGRALKHLGD